MRILGTIVQVPARQMTHIGQHRSPSDTVAAQAIGDDALRLVLQTSEQSLEEPLRRGGISAVLDEDVEHYVRKVAFCRHVILPRPAQLAIHALRRAKRMLRRPAAATGSLMEA